MPNPLNSNSSITITKPASGKGYRIEALQFLPQSRERIFEFFSDATKLQILTPAWLHFSVVTPSPIELKEGTLIDYRLRVHGLPLRWRSRISVWEPPFRFVDEQLKGPYRKWYHEHLFEEVEGGMLCRDRVDYRVYGGPLMNTFFIRRDLRNIFAYRQAKLAELFSVQGV